MEVRGPTEIVVIWVKDSATWGIWTLQQWRRHGVNMSTSLLPELVPEIDANPAFFAVGKIWGSRSRLELDSPLRINEFAASVGYQKLKDFQLQGGFDTDLLCPTEGSVTKVTKPPL